MVIPVHDLNPLRRTPWVTYALIALNVVIFLLSPGTLHTVSAVAAFCQQEAFYDHWGAIPHEMITGHQLLRPVPTGQEVGTAHGPACVLASRPYHKNPWLSVLTAMFVHTGWLHLLGNMLFLLIFGNNIEDRFGRIWYPVFYLACGYVAAYGFAAMNAGSADPLVGASGAISGILGAYLVLYPRARVWSLVPFLLFIPLPIPAWIVLGLWFVLQWVDAIGHSAAGGGVAYLAHVFGFVAGMLVGLAVRARGSGQAAPRPVQPS
ncbi:MAG TPA: rhomboid family intramembrane serine protease [Streptosporangiaceae bacterium]